MTEREAMEIIMQVAYDGEFPLNSNEAFGIACKALEKQIPKKPKCYEDKFIHCPSCGIGFGYKWEYYPTKVNDYSIIQYCYGCGKKIDWNEVRQA